MARHGPISYTTGATVRAMRYNRSGQIRDATNNTWDSWADGDIADYDIACTEDGSSGQYWFDDPTGVTDADGGYWIAYAGAVSLANIRNTIWNESIAVKDANLTLIEGAAGPVSDWTDYIAAYVGGNITFNLIGTVSGVDGTVDANITEISSDTVAADNLERWFDGTVGFATASSVITGSLSGAVGSVTGSVGSIASGGISSSSFAAGAVNAAAIASDAITAAKIAADAIGASELAADAVTEIQSGLSSLDAAGIRAAVGLASANLDTQLGTIDDFLDTEITAIKAKTDLIVTFPTNFSSLGINASGHVSRVTLVDTLTTYTGDTPQTGDVYALANGANGFVAIKGQTAAIETDTQDIQSRLPTALISGRMDSNVQAIGTGVIVEGSFGTGAITATVIATDALGSLELSGAAVTEIADAIAAGSAGATAAQVWSYTTRTLTGPVRIVETLQHGEWSIVKGDSRLNADGKAVAFSNSSSTWPTTLVSGSFSVRLEIEPSADLIADLSPATPADLQVTGTIVDVNNVRFDITSTQSATLSSGPAEGGSGKYRYNVVAHKSGVQYTLESGTVVVEDNVDA